MVWCCYRIDSGVESDITMTLKPFTRDTLANDDDDDDDDDDWGDDDADER